MCAFTLLALNRSRSKGLLAATTSTKNLPKNLIRCYSAIVGDTAPVEVDHYSSPWWKSFGDFDDYKSEKFRIQTFNKISPKVSSSKKLV
jgi:hypothetical protein